MKFRIERIDATGETRFEGSFNARELADLKFNPLERALLTQPLDNSPASDYLLTLETIYRKHEQTQAAAKCAVKQAYP